jgi:hypothetical protein
MKSADNIDEGGRGAVLGQDLKEEIVVSNSNDRQRIALCLSREVFFMFIIWCPQRAPFFPITCHGLTVDLLFPP